MEYAMDCGIGTVPGTVLESTIRIEIETGIASMMDLEIGTI